MESSIENFDGVADSANNENGNLISSYSHLQNVMGQRSYILPPTSEWYHCATFMVYLVKIKDFNLTSGSIAKTHFDSPSQGFQALKSHQFGTNIKNNNNNNVSLTSGHPNMNLIKSKTKSLSDSFHFDLQSRENNENHNDENYMHHQMNGEIIMEVDKKSMTFSTEQVQCECD